MDLSPRSTKSDWSEDHSMGNTTGRTSLGEDPSGRKKGGEGCATAARARQPGRARFRWWLSPLLSPMEMTLRVMRRHASEQGNLHMVVQIIVNKYSVIWKSTK